MSVSKKQLSGKRVSWGYRFSVGPRAAREHYKQGGFATRDAAIQAEAAKRLELARAVKIKATGTLRHTIQRFFGDRGEALSPKTLDRYRELAEYLHPDLLAMPITDIRAMDLHEEWRRLKTTGGHKRGTGEARPLSAKTVRNICSLVSAACSYAVLYGLISVNPATASKPPHGRKREGIALSAPQTELMVSAAPAEWLMDMLEVAHGLGIRRGEALALRWSDFWDEPDERGVLVPTAHVSRSLCQVGQSVIFKGTKSDKPRKVSIPAPTMAVLQRHGAAQARDYPGYDVAGDLVFCDALGAPLKPDSVSAKVSRLCRLAKLPKGVSLHTLRHTHASQLVADGADPGAVAARMGHSDAHTTLGIYSHAVPGSADLADKWEKLQGKKPQ